jgi:hypothetical protein
LQVFFHNSAEPEPATAKALDSVARRLAVGAIVTDNEIRSVLYAVAVVSPDEMVGKIADGPEPEFA